MRTFNFGRVLTLVACLLLAQLASAHGKHSEKSDISEADLKVLEDKWGTDVCRRH